MNEDDYWPNACAPGPQGKDKPGCSSKLAQLGIAAILAVLIWHTATAQERTIPPPPQPIVSPLPTPSDLCVPWQYPEYQCRDILEVIKEPLPLRANYAPLHRIDHEAPAPFPPQWVNMIYLPVIQDGLRITGCNSDMENCP